MGRMPMQAGSNESDPSHTSAGQPQLTQKCCCPTGVAPSTHVPPFLTAPPEASYPHGYYQIAVSSASEHAQQTPGPANPKRGPPASALLA